MKTTPKIIRLIGALAISHTARLKPLFALALLTLLTTSSGYASNQVNRTDAPDGFYVGADAVPSYALQIYSSDGGLVATVQIRENAAFIPQRFVVSATDKIPGGYFVKVSGQSVAEMPEVPGTVIVVNHTPYFGYARRVGSSATVSLLLDNCEEAKAVSSMLQKRFPSALASIDLHATNPAPSDISVQELSPSKNWHWDQAMADALLAKGNHDGDRQTSITAALAYSRMIREARANGMTWPLSEFPLPNYDAGPGRPLPIHVNFYGTTDHYPNYLQCEYDVDEKNYSQSNEPKWFETALKQIRHSGPKKFPPIEWIAVVFVNRAEWTGASTVEQNYKVGAIFKAADVFDSSRKFSQLIADANMDRHPFKYDQIQPTPGDEQRWLIVERHAATNSTPAGKMK